MVWCLFSVREPGPEEVSMVCVLGRAGYSLFRGFGHRTPHVFTLPRKYFVTSFNV